MLSMLTWAFTQASSSKKIAELDSKSDTVATVEDRFMTNVYIDLKTGQLTTKVAGVNVACDEK